MDKRMLDILLINDDFHLLGTEEERKQAFNRIIKSEKKSYSFLNGIIARLNNVSNRLCDGDIEREQASEKIDAIINEIYTQLKKAGENEW